MELTLSGDTSNALFVFYSFPFWAGLLGQVGGDGVPVLGTKAKV